MLEPFLTPRTGKAVNGLGVLASAALTFSDAGVTTPAVFLPAWVFFPLVGLFFALRFVGIVAGEWRDMKEMPWGYRGASWGVLVALFGIVGILAAREGWLALAAVCALDAGGALVPHRPLDREAWWKRARGPDLRGVRRWAVAIVAYLAVVALVHVLWASHVPHGPLIDWVALVVGFALLVRFAAPGPRARDEDARPPADHRAHAPVDRPLADPGVADVAGACRALAEDGDAGPFLDVVRATAAFGGANAVPALADAESRVIAALSRAGTSRAADIEAALAAAEAAFGKPQPQP